MCKKKEKLTIHKSGEGQVVEEVGEVLPNVGVTVLAQTLVIKTVHLKTGVYILHNDYLPPPPKKKNINKNFFQVFLIPFFYFSSISFSSF